jgi:hypothetical protein
MKVAVIDLVAEIMAEIAEPLAALYAWGEHLEVDATWRPWNR